MVVAVQLVLAPFLLAAVVLLPPLLVVVDVLFREFGVELEGEHAIVKGEESLNPTLPTGGKIDEPPRGGSHVIVMVFVESERVHPLPELLQKPALPLHALHLELHIVRAFIQRFRYDLHPVNPGQKLVSEADPHHP